MPNGAKGRRLAALPPVYNVDFRPTQLEERPGAGRLEETSRRGQPGVVVAAAHAHRIQGKSVFSTWRRGRRMQLVQAGRLASRLRGGQLLDLGDIIGVADSDAHSRGSRPCWFTP